MTAVVVVVATIRPRPEFRADVIAAMEKTIASVHASDEGCLLYALHEGDDRLVMVEKWASAAALAGRTEGDIDVQVLRPHPAGTPDQGTL
jgi:quinol monooxygenase YgiN